MTPTKALNYAVLALVLAFIVFGMERCYRAGRAAERAETAEKVLGDSIQTYRQRERHLRSLLAADSAAEATRLAMREPVEPAVTRYVTLRDTIAFTDTILVEAADAAVTTCSFALLSCESRVSSADSVIDAQAAQIRNLEAQVRTTRALAEARCDGQVPAWTLPVVGLGSAALGAWVRGQ